MLNRTIVISLLILSTSLVKPPVAKAGVADTKIEIS
jgi:hypothetical protein